MSLNDGKPNDNKESLLCPPRQGGKVLPTFVPGMLHGPGLNPQGLAAI